VRNTSFLRMRPSALVLSRNCSEAQRFVAAAGRSLCASYGVEDFSFGKISFHHYSITFPCTLLKSGSEIRGYGKIPKSDPSKRSVTQLNEADRVLAKNEYTSLEYLRDHWPGSKFGVNFVTPLAFVESSNLLITEELPGEHLHAQMRRRLLKKKLSFGSVGGDPLVPCFARIGKALGAFHREHRAPKNAIAASVADKLISTSKAIHRQTGIDLALVVNACIGEDVLEILNNTQAKTMKGFDIRNIIVDGRECINIIDPGKIKVDTALADVARFIVTIRLVFWGSWYCPLIVSEVDEYEDAFIDAWRSESGLATDGLSILVIKEVLRYWLIGLDAAARYAPNTLLESALKRYYVNRVFLRMLAMHTQ